MTSVDDQMRSLTLRVAKAVPRDAGRGMARLDPADMARIGAQVGDVVLVDGRQRSTALKIMPAYPVERGKRQIQIDGIARENVGTGLDALGLDLVDGILQFSEGIAEPLDLGMAGPIQAASMRASWP